MQVRVGMSVGHHPQHEQHTPDMRKNDKDITEKEKQEAKRRIEGSIDDSPPQGTGTGAGMGANMAV